MTSLTRAMLMTVGLTAAAISLSACAAPGTAGQPRVGAGVHIGFGRSPYWRHWPPVPPVVIVPPEIDPDIPEVELPIAPPPDIDIDGGIGGDFGGDFGGDIGGDLGGDF